MIWLGLLAGIVVMLVLLITTRPAAFRIERSTAINAPADVVFPYINDFHRWPEWSPWEKIDPDMTREYTGAPAGKGARYSWSGNSKAGAGAMTITDSDPPKRVLIDISFTRPFKAQNIIDFTLTPAPAGVNVNWAMHGNNNFMAKAFSLVMSMDKLVGKDFEKGLAALKSAAEARSRA